MADHIHTADDLRGTRDVFVNGNKIDNVTYADTAKGLIWFYPKPVRMGKNTDEIYTRCLRGVVRVVFHE